MLIYLFVNMTGDFFGSKVKAWALAVSLYVKLMCMIVLFD